MKPWEIMKAHDEGAEIEVDPFGNGIWKEAGSSPAWNWEHCKYRVKLAPKPPRYVPFTRETWPIGAWVRVNGIDYSPSYVSNESVMLCSDDCTYEWLLEKAKLLEIRDGKVVGERPCGMEVKDEN